jgi:hypothetical protein
MVTYQNQTEDVVNYLDITDVIDAEAFVVTDQEVQPVPNPHCDYHLESIDEQHTLRWYCEGLDLDPGDIVTVAYDLTLKRDPPPEDPATNTAMVKPLLAGSWLPAPSAGPLTRIIGECCVPPMRGDVNYDGASVIEISDLVYLVDYMFSNGAEPPCYEEADIDGSGTHPIDITDLVYLVDYMFTNGVPPAACP